MNCQGRKRNVGRSAKRWKILAGIILRIWCDAGYKGFSKTYNAMGEWDLQKLA
jgi:hypothetical protein